MLWVNGEPAEAERIHGRGLQWEHCCGEESWFCDLLATHVDNAPLEACDVQRTDHTTYHLFGRCIWFPQAPPSSFKRLIPCTVSGEIVAHEVIPKPEAKFHEC